jgi:predicted acyltransferase
MTKVASPTGKPLAIDQPVAVTKPAREAPPRLVSLDAYRGFVMLLMVSSGFAIARVARDYHLDSEEWQFFAYQLDHAKWVGCSFWDLIQPSFMFMVGVALPFSYASRRAKGDSKARISVHVIFRSIVLVLLGVFLVSKYKGEPDITFVNVLTQIGLGYWIVYLFRGASRIVQLLGIAVILGASWAAFAFYSLPSPNFDYAGYHVGPEERFPDPRGDQSMKKEQSFRDKMGGGGKSEQNEGDKASARLTGTADERIFPGAAMHWNKNANFAADVDTEILSMFPSPRHLKDRLAGGYTTLNFFPSIATMLLGLMAGEFLLRRRYSSFTNFLILAGAGLVCLGAGLALDHSIWPEWLIQMTGVDPEWTLCPVVKRIWTPSWVIFSAGWTFLMLAGFYLIIDVIGFKRWAFPFVIVGMNSIAIYCMAQLIKPWISEMFRTYAGRNVFQDVADKLGTYSPIVETSTQLLVLWLICLWLYRQKIFIKI